MRGMHTKYTFIYIIFHGTMEVVIEKGINN